MKHRFLLILASLMLVLSCRLPVPGEDSGGTTGFSVSTYAGGPSESGDVVNVHAAQARFDQPSSCALDSHGNLFVIDQGNQKIKKISPEGFVTGFAGSGSYGDEDGQGAEARFYYPISMAVDANDNLYVTELGNSSVRKITPAGEVSTIVSDMDLFYYPFGIDVDSSGNIYVADFSQHIIRRIGTDGTNIILAGLNGTGDSPGYRDGSVNVALFNEPAGLALSGNRLYVADSGNNRIRVIDLSTNMISTVAGNDTEASVDGAGIQASFSSPRLIDFDTAGNLFVAETGSSTIRKLDSSGRVTTVAGSSEGFTDSTNPTEARFNRPYDVAVHPDGDLFVADTGNNVIRRIHIP